MSEHLPECDSAFTDLHTANCVCRCICPELRACEQRTEEAMDRAWTQTVKLAEAHARVSAYAAGVQAARDAVAAVPREDGGYCHVLHACDVEAAIDALRGEA